MVSEHFRAANTNAPPLLVFDLVATLTDAGPRYAEAYIQMCRAWNIKPPSKEDILAALGNKNLKQIIADYTPDLPAEHIDSFMNGCNDTCDALLYNVAWHENLYANVRQTLHALKDSGYVLGVYTGTREDVLESQLRYHNVLGLFTPSFMRGKNNKRDGMVDSDALKAGQLRSIVAAYAVMYHVPEAQACGLTTVVGDSGADLQAAQRTGLAFVGFTPTGHPNSFSRCVRTFGDFKDLPALVRGEPALSPAQTRSAPKP